MELSLYEKPNPLHSLDTNSATLANADFRIPPNLRGSDWRLPPGNDISAVRLTRWPKIDLTGKQPESCELLVQFISLSPGEKLPSPFSTIRPPHSPRIRTRLASVRPSDRHGSPDRKPSTLHRRQQTRRYRIPHARRLASAPGPGIQPRPRTSRWKGGSPCASMELDCAPVRAFSAAALIVFTLRRHSALWVPDRWAVSLFQAGAFAWPIAWALRFSARRPLQAARADSPRRHSVCGAWAILASRPNSLPLGDLDRNC